MTTETDIGGLVERLKAMAAASRSSARASEQAEDGDWLAGMPREVMDGMKEEALLFEQAASALTALQSRLSKAEGEQRALCWVNGEAMTGADLSAFGALREAGCTCPLPLLGQRPGVGPRCRLCNTVAAQSEAAALRVERDEARATIYDAEKMLDAYDAPTLDDGDGGPLSIAARIEAMVYAKSLTEKGK